MKIKLSKKGQGEIQTLMYLFFAVLFILTGLISVKSYLVNVQINKNLQLTNLDFGIIANRLIASDNCLAKRSIVTLNDGEQDYTVDFVELGLIKKSKLLDDARIKRCLEGFEEGDPKYKVKFFEFSDVGDGSVEVVREPIGGTYGTLDCSRSRRKGEFLIRIEDTNYDKLGVFELCII